MIRTLLAATLLVLAVPASGGEPEVCDPDTLAGAKAELREDWVGAVDAFERALAAAPDDPLRRARLQAARRRGLSVWLDAAESGLEAGRLRSAAIAAAIARRLAPEDEALLGVLSRLERAGAGIPEIPPGGEAPRGMPRRSRIGRIRAVLDMGEVGDDVDAIVSAGQRFLLSSQGADGGWDAPAPSGVPVYDAGVSGLALMALLVDGPASLTGERGEAVGKAASWLLSRQAGDGKIGSRASDHYTYCHAIATEALAVWAHVAGETERVGPKLAAARDHILAMQVDGAGWRYGWTATDSDTSVTYWMASALDRLRLAGVPVPDSALGGAAAWVKNVTDGETGRVGYTQRGTGAARPPDLLERFPAEKTESLTAAGLVVLDVAGEREARLTRKQRGLILATPPTGDFPDMYYWHLGARALVATDDGVPGPWLGALVRAARGLEDPDGSIRPVGPWGRDGGRVYSTAITVLALSAPWAEASASPGGGRYGPGPEGVTLRYFPGPDAFPTGVYLDEGMEVIADPDGKVKASRGADFEGPDGGSTPRGRDRLSRAGRYGCLLGRIGPDGEPFAIRRRMRLRIEGCGQLYLLLNEEDPSEAEGEFLVELTRRE